MIRNIFPLFILLACVLASACDAFACSICAGLGQSLSLREQALKSNTKLVVFGHITKSSLDAAGTGKAEVSIVKTLKAPEGFTVPASLIIGQYLPFDPTAYNGILLFAEYSNGKIDVFRGVTIPSKEVADYAAGAVGIAGRGGPAPLDYYLPFLQSPSREISSDAFLEFAKSSDSTLVEFSKKMNPSLLKNWILDPKVPEERVGLYAFLLGGCGKGADVGFLVEFLSSSSPRAQVSSDGAMVALIRLDPEKGWAILDGFLKADNTGLQTRLSCIRSLKVAYDILQDKSEREKVFNSLRIALKQGELADLAVEELRRLKYWGFTSDVLGVYGAKGYTAPVMKRALLRYALSVPSDPMVEKFIAQCELKEPQLLSEVRESLGLASPKP